MPYTAQGWVDGPAGGTPLTAARLTHMEAGIVAALPGVEDSVAPVGPLLDQLWYDKSVDLIKRWNGTAWIPAGSATYATLAAKAAAPDEMAVGTITRSTTGAATSFAVVWPDGSTGTFAGTESTGFPGAIDSYTVTYVPASGPTKTYTQPALTRDGNGNVTNRPAITVA